MLAITFGRHPGASVDDLNKLGLVGMLHDVEKMRTPTPIMPEQVVNLERFANGEDDSYLIKAVVANGNYGIRIEQFIEKGLSIA